MISRLHSWLFIYRWRIAIVVGFPLGCVLIGFVAKVAVVAPALAAAGIAGVFAWGQWHTARQKLILDLFERRVARFEAVTAAVEAAKHKDATLADWEVAMNHERAQCRFLFGPEVTMYLWTLHQQAADRFEAQDLMRRVPHSAGANVSSLQDNIRTGGLALRNFQQEFVRLCAPYLRMDQKRPRPPSEWPYQLAQWLVDRWRVQRQDDDEPFPY